MSVNDFGTGLKILRNNSGHTIDELAEIAGLESSSSITHVENGTANFGFENFIKVLNAYNTTYSECCQISTERDLKILNIRKKLYKTLNIYEEEFLYHTLVSLRDSRSKHE